MPTAIPVRIVWYPLAVAVGGVLLYLVAPILTPFLVSAVAVYICLPLVDRLDRRLRRWLAAVLVMLLLVVTLASLALVVLPMVEQLYKY